MGKASSKKTKEEEGFYNSVKKRGGQLKSEYSFSNLRIRNPRKGNSAGLEPMGSLGDNKYLAAANPRPKITCFPLKDIKNSHPLFSPCSDALGYYVSDGAKLL